MERDWKPGDKAFIMLPATYICEDVPPTGERIEPMQDYSMKREERTIKDTIKLAYLGAQGSEEELLDRVHDYLGCWRQCQGAEPGGREQSILKHNKLVIGLDIIVGLGLWPLVANQEDKKEPFFITLQDTPSINNYYSPADMEKVAKELLEQPKTSEVTIVADNIMINGIPLSQYKHVGEGK